MNKIKHLSIVDGAFLHLDDHICHLLLPAAADGRDIARPKARKNGARGGAAVTA